MYASFNPFPGDILIEASRIAIWERNKIVVAISTSFWVANVVLMIRSKPYTSLIIDGRECLTRYGIVSGVVRVNIHPQLLLGSSKLYPSAAPL